MIALALTLALTTTPPVIDACAVIAAPHDYVGRKFTIRTTLDLDIHGALLNRGSACGSISFWTLEDAPARQTLVQVLDVAGGRDYWRRFGKRAPMTTFRLDGIGVTVTGTMFCPTAGGRCEIHMTDLDDVTYPPSVPPEMVPPRL